MAGGHPGCAEREAQHDHGGQRLRDGGHHEADRGDDHQSQGWPADRPRTATSRHSTDGHPGQEPAQHPQAALQRGDRRRRRSSGRRCGPSRWRPVAVTTARPRPRTTTVPADGPAGPVLGRRGLLSTGTDSPVSAASSTSSAAAPHDPRRRRCRPRRARADPRTDLGGRHLRARCRRGAPGLRGAVSSERAVIARSALTSWTTPTVVLTMTTNAMIRGVGEVAGGDGEHGGGEQHQHQRIAQLVHEPGHHVDAGGGRDDVSVPTWRSRAAASAVVSPFASRASSSSEPVTSRRQDRSQPQTPHDAKHPDGQRPWPAPERQQAEGHGQADEHGKPAACTRRRRRGRSG